MAARGVPLPGFLRDVFLYNTSKETNLSVGRGGIRHRRLWGGRGSGREGGACGREAGRFAEVV